MTLFEGHHPSPGEPDRNFVDDDDARARREQLESRPYPYSQPSSLREPERTFQVLAQILDGIGGNNDQEVYHLSEARRACDKISRILGNLDGPRGHNEIGVLVALFMHLLCANAFRTDGRQLSNSAPVAIVSLWAPQVDVQSPEWAI